MVNGDLSPVVVEGGFLESQKRAKTMQQISGVYNVAKESGLNAQGFIFEILANSELPADMKQRIGNLLLKDPYASPKVLELSQQLQQATATIQKQQNQITQLRIMASQRMERQAEYTAMLERVKRFELMFKQWQQENKDTQEARMEVLRRLLDNGDVYGATAMLQAIQQNDAPVLAEPETQLQMNDATADTMSLYQQGAGQYVGNTPSNVGQVPGAWTQPAPTANQPGVKPFQLPTAAVQPGGFSRTGFGQP
jgi:hypothetical protein